MPQNPAVDVATYLAGASIGLTLGTNLFVGPTLPVSSSVPVQSVFVVGYGGSPPGRVMGRTTEVKYASVQVRIRAADFADGLALARTIRDALENAPIAGYLDVITLQSEPVYMGLDANGNHHWSVNCELVFAV